MDEQEIFSACVRKLQEAGKSIEESANRCIRYISKNSEITTARFGNISVKTTNKGKGWVVILVILALIIIAFLKFVLRIF
ncbi:MAG: hypothetical protein IB618_03005 [Candidatus Pacearchaeota archaeon]|nr:MAG: hypothetical protein IB618_03005 [Candidatus Pacearchaeota archaeon]